MATGSLRVNQDIILATKKHHLKEAKRVRPVEAVLALAEMANKPHNVLNTVTNDNRPIILGQVTRTETYDPVTSALRFAQEGAHGIAFFTDHSIYPRDYDDMFMVARGTKQIPTLFQNYVFNDYGVMMARASGAAGLMLYSSILPPDTLKLVVSLTQRWRMSVLIQVETEEELEHALTLSANAICIGNPATGHVEKDLQTLKQLRPRIPHYIQVLSSHSISTLKHLHMAYDGGIDGVFISEELIKTPKIASEMRGALGY